MAEKSLGAESSRYELLEDALMKSTAKVVDKIKPSLWLECHPELSAKHEKELQKLHQTILKKIPAVIQDGFEILVDELHIKEKLDSLDKLEREADEKQGTNLTWRPSGNAENDLLNDDIQSLTKYKENLMKVFDKKETEVEDLKSMLTKQRKEMAEIEKMITAKIQSLDSASSKWKAEVKSVLEEL